MTAAKAVATAIAVFAAGVVASLDDGSVNTSEGVSIAIAVLGSAGVVWYATNGPAARYVKAVVAALSAGLATALIALGDNVVTTQEWWTIGVAILGATGLVASVPNKTTT